MSVARAIADPLNCPEGGLCLDRDWALHKPYMTLVEALPWSMTVLRGALIDVLALVRPCVRYSCFVPTVVAIDAMRRLGSQ